MYGFNASFASRARRAFLPWFSLRRCVLWLALSWAVIPAEAYVYNIRVWKNSQYGTILTLKYESAASLYSQFLNVFGNFGVSYAPYTGSIDPGTASFCCPLAVPSHHFRPSYNSVGYGRWGYLNPQNSLNRQAVHAWCYDVYNNGANTTVTNWVNYSIYICQECRTGSSSTGAFGFSPATYQTSTDVVPEWAWDNTYLNNFGYVYDANGNISGWTGTPKDTLYPEGAISTGSNKNGYLTWDGVTPPHWVWNEGYGPTEGGGTGSTGTDVSGIVSALGTANTSLSAINTALGGIDDKIDIGNSALSSLVNGQDATRTAINSGFEAWRNDLGIAQLQTHADLAAVAAAVGSGSSGGTTVNTKDYSPDLASLGEKIDAVKSSLDSGMLYSGDVDGDGVFTAPERSPDSEVAQAVSDVAEQEGLFDTIVNGMTMGISDYCMGAVGSFRFIGRTAPVISFHVNLPAQGFFKGFNWEYTPDLEDAFAFVTSTMRPIEVVALWLLFIWAVFRLVGGMFK